MRITVLCTSKGHPVVPHLQAWATAQRAHHEVTVCTELTEVGSGELLFLVSCVDLVKKPVRQRFRHALVIHASGLPKGRGWSPLIWQVLEGAHDIPITLFEAVDAVDAGDIWSQEVLHLEGHELHDEINAKLFAAELRLMSFAVQNVATVQPKAQSGEPTSYRRRTPEDSRLDPDKSLAAQFDLLRVADPERYPSFFELRGQCYEIIVRKSTKR
jgi:methionyl-tRNA formyltransferase